MANLDFTNFELLAIGFKKIHISVTVPIRPSGLLPEDRIVFKTSIKRMKVLFKYRHDYSEL